MLVLLGSHALNHYKYVREPMDMDLLGSYDDCRAYIKQLSKTERILMDVPDSGGDKIIVKTDRRIYEFEVAWDGSNAERLYDICEDSMVQYLNDEGMSKSYILPDIDVLYALKMSHRYRKDSPFFLKTMRDIQTMRELGAKIRPEHMEWFKEREALTYKNVLPKLNQSKKDFFDNSASIYTLDHDSIHEAVKHLDKPAYEMFKPDSAEVMTSKAMFFACPREVQLYAALEEVMVLSIERSIHPFELVGEKRRWAFDMAHMKLSTSISSGWFREFVYNEYDTVQAMYSEEYVDKFYDALHNGRIKPFEEN